MGVQRGDLLTESDPTSIKTVKAWIVFFRPTLPNQTALFRSWICTGDRWNPAAYGTYQGDFKKWVDPRQRQDCKSLNFLLPPRPAEHQPSEPDQIVVFETPDLHCRSPESGELRYISRQLKKASCSHSEGWWQSIDQTILMVRRGG